MYELTIVDELEFEEPNDTGSFNHGYTQARLVVLFDRAGQYTPVTELSLDVSQIDLSQFDLRAKEEVKPDICLYPKRGRSRPRDILKMTEMPLLAVEILSPKQGAYDILEKFKVYFELGVTSCWLVDPAIHTVTVYSSNNVWRTFGSNSGSNDPGRNGSGGGEVIDEQLAIRLPLHDIFE